MHKYPSPLSLRKSTAHTFCLVELGINVQERDRGTQVCYLEQSGVYLALQQQATQSDTAIAATKPNGYFH